MMYYVYGGWAQGINLNEYPPTVAYLFGRQTYDESTHEMQFCDEILKRHWVRTQRQLFDHAYGRFDLATRTGAYVFCLRAWPTIRKTFASPPLTWGQRLSSWHGRNASPILCATNL